MSSLDSFDNVIKGRLENHASELPPGMFRRINEARKPDPGKRPGIFWLSASLIVLLGLITFTVVDHFDMLAPSHKVAQKVENTPSIAKANKLAAEEEAIEQSSGWDYNNTEANTGGLEVTGTKEVFAGGAKSITSTVKDVSNKDDEASRDTYTNSTTAIPLESTQTFASNTQKSGDSRSLMAYNESDYGVDEIELSQMGTEADTGFEYDIRTWDTHKEEIVGERSIRNFKQSMEKIPSIEVKSLSYPVMGAAAFSSMDVGCVDFGRKKDNSNISVDLIFAPEYPVKSLSTEDSELSDFVIGREKSESVEVAFHAGIRISNRFNNGFAIRSGLYYGQIQETFNWSEVSGTQTTITTDIDSTFNDNGDLEVTYDTTTTTIPEIRQVRAYNKYRTVDIPLILGYEISRRRLVVSFNAGLLLNLSFQQRGKILSHTENQPRNILDPSQDQLFKTQLGLGFLASTGVAYRVGNRVSVLAEPSIRYILDPINTSDNPVDQKYFFTGITTGIRYHF